MKGGMGGVTLGLWEVVSRVVSSRPPTTTKVTFTTNHVKSTYALV